MVTQDSTQTGLVNLLADLRGQERKCKSILEDITHKIDAVQVALALLREKYGLASEEPERESLVAAIHGKSQPDALIMIAKVHNGRVKVTEVKRMLLEAGVITNTKTAYQQITSTLVRSKHFEKVAPGEYSLVQDEAKVGQRSLPHLT
jgi:DNA-binding transcriptional regulator YbjK